MRLFKMYEYAVVVPPMHLHLSIGGTTVSVIRNNSVPASTRFARLAPRLTSSQSGVNSDVTRRTMDLFFHRHRKAEMAECKCEVKTI